MGVKETVKRQYATQVNEAAKQLSALLPVREGWIATVRKALAMSGTQLAARVGLTKAAIYQAERKEPEGAITIKQMEKIAHALECRFVYAIIPNGQVEDVIRQQARKKAEALIRRASAHMALEKQSLSSEQVLAEIEQLTDELIRTPPSDFWEE